MYRRYAHPDHTDAARLDLTLQIKNFGPISDASLSLKPLTIFVGPNNSGKSYAAMLVHSVVSAYAWHVPSIHRPRPSIDILDKTMPILNKIRELNLEKNVIPESLIDEITTACFKIVFENELPTQIMYNFTSKLKNLVRINETTFNIYLSKPNQVHVASTNNQWSVSDFAIPKIKIIIKTDEKLRSPTSTYNNADGSISYTISAKFFNRAIPHRLHEDLLLLITNKISQGIPSQSYYLPAARSGILQGHRAITASIIKDAPYAGIKGTQVPPPSGVVADFISSIVVMPTHRGEFYKLAEDLETHILNGQIRRSRDKYRLSEIKFKFLNHQIPLHNTSSTVSEMAPLILYLKHMVHKGSLFIIEEPEAHLHPANQVILARYIARLIRSGVNILITTHSQFLLEQLSLLLQASEADSKTREMMGLCNDEFLTIDEVSPYLFSKITSGNYSVNPIECSGEEGISQEEFVKVQDALYDQTIHVEQDASGF